MVEAAFSKLRTHEKCHNILKAQLHKFLVHNKLTTDGQLKSYIVGGAVWNFKTLFGRFTFGYITYDVKTLNLVYLKDFWHTDHLSIKKKGDVY